jgi:hypothetical protein
MPALRFASACIAMAVWPTALAAQPSLELRPACGTCRLTFEEAVAFQSDWGSGGLPTRPNGVQRFARDRWLVLDPDAGLPLVFDARGRFVAPLGRKGAGPGEFSDPTLAMRWRGDSTAVFDAANARTSIFAPSGRLSRSQRWDGRSIWSAMQSADGGFVTSGNFGPRSAFGMPLHRFDATGTLRESFGSRPDARGVRASDVPLYRLPSRTDADGSFWALEARRPVLRRFRVGGVATDEWELPMRGFETFTSRRGDGAHGAEFFVVEPLADGLVLIGMTYPDPRSHEAVGPPRTVDGVTVTSIDDWGRYVNTRFYVLDPLRRELVATADEDAWVAASLGGGLFWGIRPGGDGGRLVILRSTFTRRE